MFCLYSLGKLPKPKIHPLFSSAKSFFILLLRRFGAKKCAVVASVSFPAANSWAAMQHKETIVEHEHVMLLNPDRLLHLASKCSVLR